MLTPKPIVSAQRRREEARARRDKASSTMHATGGLSQSQQNEDEQVFVDESYPANFTKGLKHKDNGLVEHPAEYEKFTEEINKENVSPDSNPDFENIATGAGAFSGTFGNGTTATWRGWESPRTGHYYDLQGPDADAVGMGPAPELGSEELSAEMAEVYAMALLRDVPFSQIEKGSGSDPATGISVSQVIDDLNGITYFTDHETPGSIYALRRKAARLLEPGSYNVDTGVIDEKIELPKFSGGSVFRGSGPGAKNGPWVSQFMLLGNRSEDFEFAPEDGQIKYGSQFISQKTATFRSGLDYMTNWVEWLDVQNGANLRGAHQFDQTKFITTPRDIATYVRFDALYQAYLNACLVLLDAGAQFQEGFPDRDVGDARTGFAAFGGPHILSLVTEVATRCLKAARREKFNWHRRARPEKISGLMTLAALSEQKDAPNLPEKTQASTAEMLKHLGGMVERIHDHNQAREAANSGLRAYTATQPSWLEDSPDGSNLLLAMAFPEGSPMHPAYAAGHATVAGGCVTMLKAFFKTIDDNGTDPLDWSVTGLPIVEATPDGQELTEVSDGREKDVTLEGELNKLAANISIGRNMAGVHYYADYYDSLRMGERVAVGILLEQMQSYDELVTIRFRSFDGDLIELSTSNPEEASVTTALGQPIEYIKWFNRHQPAPIPPAASVGV